MEYTLAYSTGSGGWYLIEDDIKDESYKWDITELPYCDSITIKIIAEDGYGGRTEVQNEFLFTIGDPPLIDTEEMEQPFMLFTMIGVGAAIGIGLLNLFLGRKSGLLKGR